jgi:V8-like Glu-specific endopeptidase
MLRRDRRSDRQQSRNSGLRRLIRPSLRTASVATFAALAIGLITPASGASDLATRLAASAVRLLASPPRTGHAFSGDGPVGALFTVSNGSLGHHFCTASVVNSPSGDLLITAAHCVTGLGSAIEFVPGYNGGKAPYGAWPVSRIYTDAAWRATGDDSDDVAFLRVSQPKDSQTLEAITGAELLGTGEPAREWVTVIGYPDTTSLPVTCANWTSKFSAHQMEFDCGGYTNGTSGGPFLAHVSKKTGLGTVIGVIGGYQQGGDTPAISYSITFGSNVQDLYKQATAGS